MNRIILATTFVAVSCLLSAFCGGCLPAMSPAQRGFQGQGQVNQTQQQSQPSDSQEVARLRAENRRLQERGIAAIPPEQLQQILAEIAARQQPAPAAAAPQPAPAAVAMAQPMAPPQNFSWPVPQSGTVGNVGFMGATPWVPGTFGELQVDLNYTPWAVALFVDGVEQCTFVGPLIPQIREVRQNGGLIARCAIPPDPNNVRAVRFMMQGVPYRGGGHTLTARAIRVDPSGAGYVLAEHEEPVAGRRTYVSANLFPNIE